MRQPRRAMRMTEGKLGSCKEPPWSARCVAQHVAGREMSHLIAE